MNVNIGKYEVKDIQKAVKDKIVNCKFLSIDSNYDILSIGIGDDISIKIIDAFYEIDPEGYWWELDVIVQNDNNKLLNMDKELQCIVTNLDLMDNFYEQVTKK